MGSGYVRDVVKWIGSGDVLNVTAATTLGPNDVRIYATIPAASTYEITLPPVGEMPWARIFVWVVATSGGTSVTVDDQDDGRLAMSPGALTAVDDYLVIDNIAGEYWLIVAEVST